VRIFVSTLRDALEMKEILYMRFSFFWRDDDDVEKKGKISIVLHTAEETQEKLSFFISLTSF
jgi:hypothetical protein